ncbi:MAG: 1-acyl-sn-glycerol-3-phosphate acyltransferase [Chitinophagaceae bacterium]|nr:1-acyl-sn-glycerol-3-phosphate acyltransferase [Chitinophagaceae bacterium]
MSQITTKFRRLRFVKALVYFFVGIASYPGLALFNKLKIEGTENIAGLPRKNVLFVSNHQTYFADVITFLHIFCAVKWGKKNRLGVPYYLLNPFTRVYYVAAAETMKKSWLSKLFTWAGAITVKRTWNKDSKEVRKGLEITDTRNITHALQDNWLITFPQGTTKPFAPGRKGTAFIIKEEKPVVIPVVIDGFSKAFDKKGLKMRGWGNQLSVKFKEPLRFTFEESLDEILSSVMDAIEQSARFNPASVKENS